MRGLSRGLMKLHSPCVLNQAQHEQTTRTVGSGRPCPSPHTPTLSCQGDRDVGGTWKPKKQCSLSPLPPITRFLSPGMPSEPRMLQGLNWPGIQKPIAQISQEFWASTLGQRALRPGCRLGGLRESPRGSKGKRLGEWQTGCLPV